MNSIKLTSLFFKSIYLGPFQAVNNDIAIWKITRRKFENVSEIADMYLWP